MSGIKRLILAKNGKNTNKDSFSPSNVRKVAKK